jgi:uncharacterized SAM-binding protein YcdF (DUF218 family)
MFVFLSKLLPIIVYPVGLSCILLIGVLILKQRKNAQKALVVIALLVLWVSGNRWVAFGLMRSLEWQHIPEGEISPADVIVVLGGGTSEMDYPRPMIELGSAGNRVLYTAKLFRDGKAPRILLSGGTISWDGNNPTTPAEQMGVLLEFMGIPADSLLYQDRSQNTYEDALYSAALVKEKGINKIILVTSAFHMPRALALFEKQGIEVIPAPTDFRVTVSSWNDNLDMNLESFMVNTLPNVSNTSLFTTAMKEYIGIFVYTLRGWM